MVKNSEFMAYTQEEMGSLVTLQYSMVLYEVQGGFVKNHRLKKYTHHTQNLDLYSKVQTNHMAP